MNIATQLYQLSLKHKGNVRSGWWSPWYVRQLRTDAAEMFRLFRLLPEPRLPRVDAAMRLVLQALGSSLCGFHYDKKRISRLFFALHNLPRAYLPADHPMRVSAEDALAFSQSWLEDADVKIE